MTEPARDDKRQGQLPDSAETQFIELSRHGDVQAFNQLVVRYQSMVYALAYRMLNEREMAADVTQDVFFSAFRNMPGFRGGSSFRAWLLRIATNLVYDHWRKIQRHPVDSLDELTNNEEEAYTSGALSSLIEGDVASNPEAHLLSQELQQLLQQGIQQLPVDQRMAVILCDIQGLSYEEIATTTQSSPGTVRSRISRGRARLREYLIQHRELLPRSYRLYTDRD